MSYYYEYELGKAAKILCEDLFKLKPGETFVICFLMINIKIANKEKKSGLLFNSKKRLYPEKKCHYKEPCNIFHLHLVFLTHSLFHV